MCLLQKTLTMSKEKHPQLQVNTYVLENYHVRTQESRLLSIAER
jgi:hypothetical protein